MYLDGDKYSARIKVFVRNTWDWVTVTFRKSDADYFERHCQPFKDGNGAMESRRIGAPTLRKRHRKWHLDFPVMEDIRLPKSSPSGQTVLSVDLGIRSACTCCVMRPDGTVLARETLSLARENDCLGHAVNRIKKAQQHGAKKEAPPVEMPVRAGDGHAEGAPERNPREPCMCLEHVPPCL